MIDGGQVPPPVVADQPQRSRAGALETIRRQLPLGARRVTDGVVRLPTVMTFVVVMFAATIALVAFGYVATREWRSGTNLLLERRANEALALVRAALSADMKGAWITAIVPFNTTVFDEDPPYGHLQVAARAFARFPYPESFVLWKRAGRSAGITYAFNRADRPPPWNTRPTSDDPFPVVLIRDPGALAGLVAAVRAEATAASPFLVIECSIEGTPYQVVAHALFASGPPHQLLGFMAFTVNMPWVHAQYFDPLVKQMEKMGGSPGGLSISVSDDQGQAVTASPVEPEDGGDLHSRFPLLFIDPALVKSIAPLDDARGVLTLRQAPGHGEPSRTMSGSGPSTLLGTTLNVPTGRRTSRSIRVREWTVHVRSLPDRALLATLQGARRMFFLITVAASASLVALVLTVRADRASAALASMKSDFVAAVTHELKTPVALIRLVGDTLANGRYTSPKTVQEYARLLSGEASRLGSSIDNLLTYARYGHARATDSTELADVEAADLVEDALQGFRPTLARLEFELIVDVPSDLPQVCVDRPAVMQALENILDNAIKYSGATRRLAVSGQATRRRLTLIIKDSGAGISRRDKARIFERFYRGSNVSTSGSGLGLPIAKRIIESHGGRIDVRSEVGVGTEVEVVLPTSGQRVT
jgi:two-component system phosphate regulon sensor histidine kinase PhoR